MRIEKVNDNQIRCTLTSEDLANRKLKLSELAYGTDKAKTLFRDMMQQASFEFGFEAEDIPLMIEAIPVSAECIVLIITKVDDPEELDTRFSKFAPSVHESSSSLSDLLNSLSEGADDILDLFKKLQNTNNTAPNLGTSSSNTTEMAEMSDEDAAKAAKAAFKNDLKKRISDASASMATVRIYSFETLDELIRLSKVVTAFYDGINSLYKEEDGYLLSISKSSHTPADYNRVCNILSEYGTCVKTVSGSDAYLSEHCEPIIESNALQSLSQL
ncbi:MAG: adaptor protein MecA [Lachnospiraceae bacterium]|nr:adaptor protein MecA [Lachnospiraceae bacterium]